MAAILFALAVDDTLACSVMQAPPVAIHCAGREVLVSDGDIASMVGDGSRAWDRQRALDELAGACDPYTDELNAIIPELRPRQPLYGKREWFLQGGMTLILEPWSPAREAELVASQRRFSLDRCGAIAFASDNNWIKRTVQMQPYCYERMLANTTCLIVISSPTLFLPFLLNHFNIGVIGALLPYLGLLSFLLAIRVLVIWRGDFLIYLAPTPFRVGVLIAVNFMLLAVGYEYDALPVSLLAYFIAGLGPYFRMKLRR